MAIKKYGLKRMLSLLIAFCMVFGLMVPVMAIAVAADPYADSTVDTWDGKSDTSWYSSSQTEFRIYTAEQLAGLALLVNGGTDFYGKTVYLENDIDLAGASWTPIGSSNYRFAGTFNGNKKTISNLTVSERFVDSGLFGYVYGANISNVGLNNASINNPSGSVDTHTGALAGYMDGGIISDCYMSGSVIVVDSEQHPAGGLVGVLSSGTVQNCYAISSVSVEAGDYSQAGGLIGSTGWHHNETVSVVNCFAISNVNSYAGSSAYSGGLIGVNFARDCSIRGCFVLNSEVVTSRYSGAVLGNRSDGTVTMTNCYYSNVNVSDSYGASSTQAENFASQSWLESSLGWDFNAVWTVPAEGEYPVLQDFVSNGSSSHAHSFTEVARSEATCTSIGQIIYSCDCGSMKADTIPQLEHDYVSGVCSRCGAAAATVDVWDGAADTTWYNAYDSSFTISTAEQLAGLAKLANEGKTFSGITIYLDCDIDLANLEWTPIGKADEYAYEMLDENVFCGIFEGNGHVVKNMKFTQNNGCSGGLFGSIYRAVIRNVGVDNVNITLCSPGRVGSLCGISRNSLVENCYATGTLKVSTSSASETHGVGGLVGDIQGGVTLKNSYANCIIENDNYSDSSFSGGLVGLVCNDGDPKYIINCYSAGSITGSSSSSKIGGIVGELWCGSLTIENCFTNTTIECGHSEAILGFKGTTFSTPLSIINTYYCGTGYSSFGGKSTNADNFQDQSWLSSTLGWDFDAIWSFKEGNNYPVLKAVGYGTGVDVHTHTFEETSRVEPGCTTYGEASYSCICGVTKTVVLEPLQHSYQIVEEVEPSCTSDGYIKFACQNANCGATKQQHLERLGHNYGNDNVCDRCNHTIQIHEHDYEVEVTLPTCTEIGYTEYTCECGHSYRDSYVEPTRHIWDAGVETVTKTCTTDGVITYTCQGCSTTKTTVVPAGHEWDEVTVTEKTCTTEGSKMKTCLACDIVEIEIIPASHNWDEGYETLSPSCEAKGTKSCTCLDCYTTEIFEVDELGHNFYNGVCTRCDEKFIDNITPSTHPLYGMYFEIDDILSDYGPSLIDEYGLMLDYNNDANLEKVAVFLTQDGTMWRRCIAVKGTNIEYATYVPYLSYQSEIKYTGLNHDWINIFRLSENNDGIWCYSNFATIGVNLEDAYGNLLLSLYDIGQAGAETRIFDDLNEMIAWLNDDCFEHQPGDWIVDKEPSCQPGSRHNECTVCQKTVDTEEIPPIYSHSESDWIIDSYPSATQAGMRHKECVYCGDTLETEVLPIFAKLVVDKVVAKPGKTIRVTVDIQDNPGIMGAILEISYDSALTLVGVEAGSAWSSLSLTTPATMSNPCTFVWDGINGADYGNGTVIVLIFEVPNDAYAGASYEISASYAYGNIVDENLNPLDVMVENGSITVTDMIGDVNDDGIIDVADVVTLRRYIAGGYGIAIDETRADMDSDGQITVADVILLRRAIVG